MHYAHHNGAPPWIWCNAPTSNEREGSRTIQVPPLGCPGCQLFSHKGVSPCFHCGNVKDPRLNRVVVEMALFPISTLDLQRCNLSVFANEATADVDDSCCAATFSWSCLTTFCMSHTLFRLFSLSLTCTTPFCFEGANTKKIETLFLQLDELEENEGLITTPIP